MTAITVTPDIVRVIFLLRSGNSLRSSFFLSARIISAFEGVLVSWYLAATCILARLRSSWLGERISVNLSIISLIAWFVLKSTATTVE